MVVVVAAVAVDAVDADDDDVADNVGDASDADDDENLYWYGDYAGFDVDCNYQDYDNAESLQVAMLNSAKEMTHSRLPIVGAKPMVWIPLTRLWA